MGVFRDLSIDAVKDIREGNVILTDEVKGRSYPFILNPNNEKIIFEGHDGWIKYGVIKDKSGKLHYKAIHPEIDI